MKEREVHAQLAGQPARLDSLLFEVCLLPLGAEFTFAAAQGLGNGIAQKDDILLAAAARAAGRNDQAWCPRAVGRSPVRRELSG